MDDSGSSSGLLMARSPRRSGLRQIDAATSHVASNGVSREINHDILLELIRLHQPLSRVELARLSGLQPSTVSEIVEQLLNEDWICEGALIKGARGRPRKTLTMNHRIAIFALDIRPEHAMLAVVDLSGRFLVRENVMTLTDPKISVRRILNRMSSLRLQYQNNRFEGIGVSVPGRVHPVTQELLFAPNLPWRGFNIREALENGMHDLQVEIENDANACLVSELWSGRLRGAQHVVLVAVSEGLGTAIMAGGQMHSGHNGLAGEFGHIQIDPQGPLCRCGQRGCWEVLASSTSALRNYQELSGDKSVTDISELLRLVEEGDPVAYEAVKRQVLALGRGLRLIVAALSPETILVTGELTSVWDKFGAMLAAELQAATLVGRAPMLITAGDGESARLHGAAAVLMHAHLRYLRSTRKNSPVARVHSA